MSQNQTSEVSGISFEQLPVERDYMLAISEEGNDSLEKVTNTILLLADLLDAKAEMKNAANVPARQMASVFELLSKELGSVKSGLFEPGGIFSQREVATGLNLIKKIGLNQSMDILNHYSDSMKLQG